MQNKDYNVHKLFVHGILLNCKEIKNKFSPKEINPELMNASFECYDFENLQNLKNY